MDNTQYITKEKFKALQEELKHLTTVKRKEIAKKLDEAASMGDLKENAEYHQARDAQGELELRIRIIEAVLKDAEIVDGAGKKDYVDIGSMVVLCKTGEKDCVEYTLVGAEEADMLSGKLSFQSPLAQAMLEKKKGDKFSFEAPSGVMEYKIVDLK